MHEAGPVGRAMESVIGGWPASRRGGRLEIEIRDGTRAETDSVAFYVDIILADHGYSDVTYRIETRGATCALCGAPASPTPADPQCDRCGAPLPAVPGPAIVCREVP